MSRNTTKPTIWPVCPAKTQISLGIRPVWSESSLCVLRIAKASSCGQWRLFIRLGGCPGWSESSLGAHVILLVMSWGGSFYCHTAKQLFRKIAPITFFYFTAFKKCIRAVSPEPSLLAHTSSESRGTFRQKARSLAPLNGWACAVKICHDGMFEDTNSLDAAHIFFAIFTAFRPSTSAAMNIKDVLLQYHDYGHLLHVLFS